MAPSSPSIRRSMPDGKNKDKKEHLSIEEVAARSQRQLVVVAVAGSLISIGIVVTFILFHVFSLAGGDGAVTGSSLIEAEKHIVHMYKKGHHTEALEDLNALIHDKPLQHYLHHLKLMEELLVKSNLQSQGQGRDRGKEGSKVTLKELDEKLFRDIESALGVIDRLKADPDNSEALEELDTHVKAILAEAGNAEPDDTGVGKEQAKKEL